MVLALGPAGRVERLFGGGTQGPVVLVGLPDTIDHLAHRPWADHHCRAAFAARGIPVQTVDVGQNRGYNGFVHEGSAVLATAATVRWFSRLSEMRCGAVSWPVR